MPQCRICQTRSLTIWHSPCQGCLAHAPAMPSGAGSAAILTGIPYRVFKQWKIRPTPRLDRWAKNLALTRCQLDWVRDRADYLHPIPQAPQRSRELGHWPAGDLARWLGRETGLPVIQLLHPHQQGQQGRRSRCERQARLLHLEPLRQSPVFRLPITRSARILLIDDIRTTGGTLRAAQESLAVLGFENVYSWTLGLRPAPRSDCRRAGAMPYPSVTNSRPATDPAPLESVTGASGTSPSERSTPSS